MSDERRVDHETRARIEAERANHPPSKGSRGTERKVAENKDQLSRGDFETK